jgi:branched-chain amino acid transport system ATP-binding protein
MLRVNEIDVFYGKIQALDGVSLEVPEGSLVVVLGNNGAGKSTLINTISGLLNPVKGNIEFQGRNINHLRPDERVKIGITQIPEGRQIFASITVKENLALGALLRKDRSAVSQDLERIFEYFPILRERQTQIAGTLSGGEQQQLAIARGLLANPKLLLVDEPSLGLAPILVEEIFKIIERLNREDKLTMMLVEQNASISLPISKYTYVLQNGKIMIQGESQDLINNDSIRFAYLRG